MALPNINVITERLAGMPDNALAQYAQMNQEDPYIMALAVSEKNRRGAMRQAATAQQAQGQSDMPTVAEQEVMEMAPAQSGISTLPAPTMDNIGMAGGGIIAFAAGGPSTLDVTGPLAKALQMEGVEDPATISFIKALYAQESSSGKNTRTSNRGARGGLQVTPIAFKDVNSGDLDFEKSLDQLRAGIRYAKQGLAAAGGDTTLAATYYYGGPGGMAAAKKGEARSDPENPKAPSTLEYAQQVTAKMGESAAAPAAPATPAAMDPSSIPSPSGQTYTPQEMEAVYQAPDKRVSDFSFMENVYGGLENLGSGVQNALTIPAAGLAALKDKAVDGTDFQDAYRKRMVDLSRSPATEAGQAQARVLADVYEASKLPPIMPGISGVAAQGPRAAGVRALAQDAKTAGTAAEAAAAKVAAPRLAPPPKAGLGALTPEAQQTRAAAELARQKRGLAADTAAADAARGKADTAMGKAMEAVGKQESAQGINTRNAALTGQAEAGVLGAGIVGRGGTGKPVEDAAPIVAPAPMPDLTKKEEKKLIDAAGETLGKEERKGFSNEDMLMLGLNLLANPSPRFSTALGEAGLATLKARMDRRGTDEAADLKGAQADYYRSQAEYMRGAKKQNDALKLVADGMEAWAKSNPAAALDPTLVEAQRKRLTMDTFRTLGLPVTSTMSSTTGRTGWGQATTD